MLSSQHLSAWCIQQNCRPPFSLLYHLSEPISVSSSSITCALSKWRLCHVQNCSYRCADCNLVPHYRRIASYTRPSRHMCAISIFQIMFRHGSCSTIVNLRIDVGNSFFRSKNAVLHFFDSKAMMRWYSLFFCALQYTYNAIASRVVSVRGSWPRKCDPKLRMLRPRRTCFSCWYWHYNANSFILHCRLRPFQCQIALHCLVQCHNLPIFLRTRLRNLLCS